MNNLRNLILKSLFRLQLNLFYQTQIEGTVMCFFIGLYVHFMTMSHFIKCVNILLWYMWAMLVRSFQFQTFLKFSAASFSCIDSIIRIFLPHISNVLFLYFVLSHQRLCDAWTEKNHLLINATRYHSADMLHF